MALDMDQYCLLFLLFYLQFVKFSLILKKFDIFMHDYNWIVTVQKSRPLHVTSVCEMLVISSLPNSAGTMVSDTGPFLTPVINSTINSDGLGAANRHFLHLLGM